MPLFVVAVVVVSNERGTPEFVVGTYNFTMGGLVCFQIPSYENLMAYLKSIDTSLWAAGKRHLRRLSITRYIYLGMSNMGGERG